VDCSVEDTRVAVPAAELAKLSVDVSEGVLLWTGADSNVEDANGSAGELEDLGTGILFAVEGEGNADEETGSTTELENVGAAMLLAMEIDGRVEDGENITGELEIPAIELLLVSGTDAEDANRATEELGTTMFDDKKELLLLTLIREIAEDVLISAAKLDETTGTATAEVLVNREGIDMDTLGETIGSSELDVTTKATELDTGKTAEEATVETSTIGEDVAATSEVVVELGIIHCVERNETEGSEEMVGEAGLIKEGADDDAGADPSVAGRLELAAGDVTLSGATTLDWCRDDDGAAIGEALLEIRVLDSDGATAGGSDELTTTGFGTEVETGRGESGFELAERIGATELAVETGDRGVDDDGPATDMGMLEVGDGLATLLLENGRTGGVIDVEEVS